MKLTARRQKRMQAEKRARINRYVWGSASFVIVTLVTLFSYQWVVPLLPGPRAEVTIDEQSDTHHSDSSHCTTYEIDFQPDEEIDSAYLRIVFPRNIKGAQFGYGAERVVGQPGVERRSLRPGGLLMNEGVGPVTEDSQAWETGRDSGGECAILHTGAEFSPGASTSLADLSQGVSSVVSANVLTIRTSKIAAKKPVGGLVVVSEYETPMTSGIPTFEGNYEYSKWGLTQIKRKFKFRYGHFSRNLTIYVPPAPSKSESE